MRAQPASRPVPTSTALLAAAAVAAVLAGCSSGDDVTTVPGGGAASDPDSPVTSVPVPSDTKSAPSTEPPATGPATEADLTVVVDDGAGTTTTHTLTCSGGEVGGTLPTASDACTQLAEIGSQAFAAPPADLMCTEIYGGPQTATVTGTFAGAKVSTALARTDGCEIGRWDALSALLGAAGDPDS